MSDIQNIAIRQYRKDDRDFVRYLCCQTAFEGNPVETFFNGRDIIADLLTLYHTDFEPESSFIVEINGEKAGYITGYKDLRRYKRIF